MNTRRLELKLKTPHSLPVAQVYPQFRRVRLLDLSLTLLVPKTVAEAAKLDDGDTLDVYVEGPGAVSVRKQTPKPTFK